jgi:hypothetical protein
MRRRGELRVERSARLTTTRPRATTPPTTSICFPPSSL